VNGHITAGFWVVAGLFLFVIGCGVVAVILGGA